MERKPLSVKRVAAGSRIRDSCTDYPLFVRRSGRAGFQNRSVAPKNIPAMLPENDD